MRTEEQLGLYWLYQRRRETGKEEREKKQRRTVNTSNEDNPEECKQVPSSFSSLSSQGILILKIFDPGLMDESRRSTNLNFNLPLLDSVSLCV